MDNEKLELLRLDLQDEFEVGTLEEFSSYLSDLEKRKMFFEQVIQPRYDVGSMQEFEELYGLNQDLDIEKKNPDGTPIVPGGPGSPDAPSNIMEEEENSDSPINPGDQPPSSDGGEISIEDDVIPDNLEDDIVIGGSEAEFDFDVEISDGVRNDEGELATAMEREFGFNGFTNFFGDMYRGYQTGAAQGNAVDEFMALALKKSESVTDKEIEQFLEAQRRLESQPESYEMGEFRRISALNGGGFMGMMTGLMDNFSIAPAVLVQSVRSMANAHSAAAAGASALVAGGIGAGTGAALGTVTGPLAPIASSIGALFGGGTGAIGGAIGGATTALEGALSFAEFFKEELEKQGLPLDQSGVRALLEQPLAMSRIRNRALSRGLTIGTVEAVTMGLSKGVVTSIAKAGGKVAQKGLLKNAIKGTTQIRASRVAAALAGTATEAVGGSSGEALGRLVAGQEMDEIDIFLEGIAGVSTAPISVTRGLLAVPTYTIKGEVVSQATIDSLIKKVEEGGMTMEELASPELDIKIKNDPARKKLMTDFRSYAKLGLEIDPNIADVNDRKTVLDLEYAKRAIKNPDLETSKVKIKAIDKVLKAFSDKYNGNLDAEAKAQLEKEGVETPTQEQIKIKADAIFKSITEKVDVQKLTEDSRKVGKRYDKQESSEQSEQETQDTNETTKTEKTKVTKQQAIDALKEEGNNKPTAKEVVAKLAKLQEEVNKIEETESQTEDSVTRNEAVEKETKTKDGATIKVKVEQILGNLQTFQGKKIVGEVATKAYNKIVNISKRAAVAVNKILPKTKIVIIEDPATYKLLTGKENPGTYKFGADTIFINASKANIATIGHEIGHAILIQGLKKGEANITGVTTRMFNSLLKGKNLDRISLTFLNKEGKKVTQSMADYLQDFASNYSENLQNEEKIVELIGHLAGNFAQLDVKEKGLIRRFLDKIMKGVGLGKYVNELTNTDKKVVSFLNAIAGKLASGTELNSADVSLLDELQAEQDLQESKTEKTKPKKKPKAKKKTTKKKSDVKIKPKKKPKAKAPTKGEQKETKGEQQFEKDLTESGTAAVGNPTEINTVDKKIQDRDSIKFKESYDMSLVKPSDKVDIVSLINDIARKKQKVWFWVADQLGYGMYDGVQMDAGPSYALQPENRKAKKVWASGKSANFINKNLAAADYLMIMSGSPRVSKLFNKKVYDAYVNKMGEFNAFKTQVLGMKKVPGKIKNILNKNDSWASLRRSPARKQFLLGIENAERTPTTELHKLLEGKNAFVDIEAIRDGFYKENDFAMNDIMMVLKPTKAGQESNHSTYQNDVLGEVVGVPDKKINAFDIMPEALKAKYENVLTRTQQSQAVAPFGSGVRDIETIQDRDQQSMGRFIDDNKLNERGFMPANIFNVGLLRKQAREFGFGVKEARFREGYRAGEISGYYLTKGGRFFNPRSRYQILNTDNSVDIIVDARKNNLSEAAIRIALDAKGMKKVEIEAAIENADFYTDISAEVPSAFKIVGEKIGGKLYNKVINFVKEKNIDNAKPNKRKSAKELAVDSVNKRESLTKQAKLKSNETIESLVNEEQKRLKGLKRKLSPTEIKQKVNNKLFALQRENQDKLNRIDNRILKFEQEQIIKNDKLAEKLSKADIINLAVEVLQNDPTYIDAKGRKQGKSDLQNLMIDQLLASLATKATANVNKKILDAKLRLKKVFGNKKTLTKKEIFYTQTQLINLVKQTIPSAIFETAAVQNLLKQIRDVAKPGRDVNDIVNIISGQINTINSKYLFSEIETILRKSYTQKAGGVVKAKKITGTISDRIKGILKNTLLDESNKLELAELEEQVTLKNSSLQDLLNIKEKELKTSPESTEKLLDEMVDIEIAMQINNSLVMDNTNKQKVSSLSEVLENLEELVLGGESALKLLLKNQQQQHMDNINAAYEAITGKKLDLSKKENVKIANKAITDSNKLKDRQSKRIFVISRVYTAIADAVKGLRTTASDISLLMAKIDVLPGQLFGGVMQDLVYEKINESSYAFKQFQIDNKKMLIDKAVELFVTKKFLGVKKPSFIQKRQARKALRKMSEITRTEKANNKTKLGKLFNKLGVSDIYKKITNVGRLDAKGNPIYRNPAAVNKALETYENSKGIKRIRNKAILRDVMDKEVFDYNDAQMYYLYNQYKDPSNHINFAMNGSFGKDHARIMSQLEESMTPELKAWADWQVNEMYPMLYERYNDVYKKIYHINLPWNDQYGGRLYLDGIENDAVSLIGQPNIYGKTKDIKSASLFNRVHHNNPIQVSDGNTVLSTYLTDMDWFASYAENINSISNMFRNEQISGAIKAKEGDFFYKAIDTIIENISSRGINSSRTNKMITIANNFFIATRIALTPIIAAKQLLSTFTYVSDIGVVNWFKMAGLMTANTATFGKFGQGFVGASKEVFANSPYLKDRYSSGFQRVLEAYGDQKTTTLLPSTYMQFMMNFNMFFSKAGDAGAIFMGGIPNYLYYKQEALKQNPNLTDQQAIDIAINKFQKSTKQTQQSSDLQDKDMYQMGDSNLRFLTMFKTTPKQYLRKSMYSQIQMGRKLRAGFNAMFLGKNPIKVMAETGKGTFFQNLRNYMLYYMVMPVTFQYMSMGMPLLLKPDLDDDDVNDLARAAMLGNLGALFIVGDLIKGFSDLYIGDKAYAQEIGQGLPLFELASIFNKKYARWERLKPGPLKDEALLQFVGTAGDLAGLPGSKGFQAISHFNKISNNDVESDAEVFMRAMGYSEYVIKNSIPKTVGPPEGSTVKEVRDFYKKLERDAMGENTGLTVKEAREKQKKAVKKGTGDFMD